MRTHEECEEVRRQLKLFKLPWKTEIRHETNEFLIFTCFLLRTIHWLVFSQASSDDQLPRGF